MRSMILLSSILLLSAVWAAAQSVSDSDRESYPPSARTIEGCLDAVIGNYTLTDYAGASYPLTGNTEQLKSHDGETIQVTAVVIPVVHVPGAMSEGTETRTTLSVISFKQVSSVCGDRNDIP